jgi:magnesium-transporting ATPase (P-type)
MVHFFAILLWGAGTLAFVASMPGLGVAIFTVVVINDLFAFAQEYRAERAAERLPRSRLRFLLIKANQGRRKGSTEMV